MRMPPRLHDKFTRQLLCLVENQLAQVRRQTGTLGNWAENIESDSTSDIQLHLAGIRSDRSKRSPDEAFSHKHAKFPGVVIEVAYSQKRKDLPKLADDYILGTNGNMKMVMGFDLEYGGSNSAKANVWKPQYTTNPTTSAPRLSTELVYEKVNYYNHPLTHYLFI